MRIKRIDLGKVDKNEVDRFPRSIEGKDFLLQRQVWEIDNGKSKRKVSYHVMTETKSPGCLSHQLEPLLRQITRGMLVPIAMAGHNFKLMKLGNTQWKLQQHYGNESFDDYSILPIKDDSSMAAALAGAHRWLTATVAGGIE